MRVALAALAAALAFSGVIGVTEARPAGQPVTSAGATAVAQGILARMNAARARAGLPPLVVSGELSAAAVDHSLELGRAGVFEHGAFVPRIRRFYRADGWAVWAVGENLYWGPSGLRAGRVVRDWLRSPSHRQHVLGAMWREVGIAVLRLPAAPGVYGGQSVAIVTADFGVRS